MAERTQNSINMGMYALEEAVLGGEEGSLTATIDWSLSTKFDFIMDDDYEIIFSPPQGACNLVLKLTNGGIGTITWDDTVYWIAGTEPEWTASGVDIVSFFYDGSYYYGAAGLDFQLPA